MTDLDHAIELAVTYLAAMENRDLETARGAVAGPGLELVFPGDRRFGSIDEIVKNSSGRYRFVKKHIIGRDAWAKEGAIRVLITGTLYGEWPDGTAFEGVRFADLFDLRDGKIVRQHVWNDAGERLIAMRKAREE